jgi:hypothetical protein
MRIAIIGGGFYGFHLANEILNKSKNAKIDIFEKEDKIFTGAFTNNQHRLHLGYHYPRSKETIIQSISNYQKFLDIYNNFIKIPKNNIYSVYDDSFVSFDEYTKIYNFFSLNFDIIKNEELKIITNNKLKVNKITGSIRTREGTVDFYKISEYLKEKLSSKVNIFLGKEVTESPSGYDIVINATYNYPNFLLNNKKIPIKHELCCLLVGKDILNHDVGITIMDGPYCSIFPHINNLHSISSVPETPFFKYKDSDKKYSKEEIKNLYEEIKVKEKILHHMENFIHIDKEQIVKEMLSIKTKFDEDAGDTREAIWVREDNHYSIFCGKISAICSISEEIINDIGF